MASGTIPAALILASGTAAAFADSPRTPEMSPKGYTNNASVVGHIYINPATGERVATRSHDRSRGDCGGTSGELWMNDNDIPCADIDPGLYTAGFVGRMDDLSDPAEIGHIYLDWADVPMDTVIDAVQVMTFSDCPDADADGDGMGDGVIGSAASWSFYEIDNGFNSCRYSRIRLIEFTLVNIPGNTNGGTSIQGYLHTVDLSDYLGDGTTDLSFEFGDTDGDPQSAAFHNPFIAILDIDSDGNPDGDLDDDGLMDVSWALHYIQPGTKDLDGDGVVDGDIADQADNYVQLSAPRGVVAPVPPTTFTIDGSFPGGSAGQEDAFNIHTDVNNDGFWEYAGTYWYGGFTCDRDADGVFEGDDNASFAPNGPNDYRPHGSFFIRMFGPAGGVVSACPPDIDSDGLLNFFDVAAFIGLYNTQDCRADFYPAGAPDGVFNFFDVSEFISAYSAGCP